MSGSNADSIFRIEKKGVMRVAFGDGKPFEFDVIKAYNDWWDVRREFEDESGKVQRELYPQMRLAQHNFVCALAGIDPEKSPLTQWDVDCFMNKAVIEKAEELIRFFEPPSKEKPSSSESTELRFET